MGDVEERPLSSAMVSSIGEKITFPSASRWIQALPNYGNQSKVAV